MTFTGFGPDANGFLDALTKDNSRQFFEAHRQEYVDAIRQPLEDLLGEAETIYGPGRVMRPNRDVRFSTDKSPYKTSASMWAGTVGGVYLSLSAQKLEVGGGIYDPSRDQLARARTAIDSVPRAASRLTEIIDALVSAGFEMRHYAALTTLPVDAPPVEIRNAWKAVEALIEWGDTYVKAAQSWP